MYIEDFDLSYTILKTGRTNYYLPVTSVIHYKGESTVKDGTYMVRFKQGMQRFYQKQTLKGLKERHKNLKMVR